jgi:NAD(P)-dependent dehydrogenase (short-subunit alcohol dehydrogenase family)
VLKAFAPLLRRTASASAARSGSSVAATVAANLSARVSSIRENRLGGWHSYRASKTALNMLTKSAAVELGQGGAPVICLLLHPGTVATDLSRPFNRNGAHSAASGLPCPAQSPSPRLTLSSPATVPAKMLFTAETAVRCLLHVIAKAGPEDSGKLLCWDGTTVDW